MEGVELEDEPVPQNKRKKRKIIDKLVVHDDGFMGMSCGNHLIFALALRVKPKLLF